MRWFKFYAQDWLTDPKILAMSTVDKLLYLTLLCMASAENKEGLIPGCTDQILMRLAGIEFDPTEDHSDYEIGQGFLKRVNDNAMITLDDNGDVTVLAFQKRQGTNLSGYERVKRYREKKAQKGHINSDNINDNIHDNANDNMRIEEKRTEESLGSAKNAETPLEVEAPQIPSFEEWMKDRGFQWVSGPEMPDGSYPDVWGDEHGARLPLKRLRELTLEHKRLSPRPPKEIPVLAQNTAKLISLISEDLKHQFGASPIFGKEDHAILSSLIKRHSFEFVKKYGKWFFRNEAIDKKWKFGAKGFASNSFINQFIADTGISPE